VLHRDLFSREAGMTIGITRDEHTAEQMRAEAARSRDGGFARRLLGLALVLEGVPRWKAAEMSGMSGQTLCAWVHRYNTAGLAGLRNRACAGGPKPKLTAAQEAALAGWVDTGPDLTTDKVVRWRRQDLRDKLRSPFGVMLHERSVGKILHRLGFSHLSVRPCHPKAIPDAQRAHKKTSVNSLQTPSQRRRGTSRSNSGGRCYEGGRGPG
jgi:putative transposase